MEYRFTVHAHTDAVDGKSSAKQMVEAALARKMAAIGFTEHAPQRVDARYGMTDEAEARYIAEIRALQAEYAGRIAIHLGVERDAFSHADRSKYEYILGSAHYIDCPGFGVVAVDGQPERLRDMIDRCFGGDGTAMAAAYFQVLGDYVSDYRPDVIGHFDLVTKHNEDGSLLVAYSTAYLRAAIVALERCLPSGAALEINTGAISRGYRSQPYPSQPLLNAWREMGGCVTIGTDSHHADTVDAYFDAAVAWARRAGYRSVRALGTDGLFLDVNID